MTPRLKPLWQCPKCKEHFVTRNIWHSCGKFELADLFAKSEPHVFEIFRRLEHMVYRCGPAKLIPQKTRAVFQARIRFVACYPRKSYLDCGILLPRRLQSERIVRFEESGGRLVANHLRIYARAELDAEVQRWLKESYKVGTQELLHGELERGSLFKRKQD